MQTGIAWQTFSFSKQMYSFLLISLGILLNVAYIADAFYLSGWAPRKFHPNEKVP